MGENAKLDMAVSDKNYLKGYEVGLYSLESGSKRIIEIESIMIMGS